jgi:hypothetical protein
MSSAGLHLDIEQIPRRDVLHLAGERYFGSILHLWTNARHVYIPISSSISTSTVLYLHRCADWIMSIDLEVHWRATM